MKDKKNLLLVVACVICLTVISCQSVMDRVTPCEVSEQTYEFVTGSLDGYKEVTSLYDVKKLRNKMIIQHRTSLVDLMRMIEDENYAYGDARDSVLAEIKAAQELQELVIGGPNTDFSLLGILAGFTGGTAIGRMIKRKGDYSPSEVEEVVAKAKRRAD
ncbi:hypothetical protein LCGC14_0423100 [marine sediment metagenome]|uniref:Uncharacterized protein n=1 Tax=marine sediment metagenome TaxID=412755 RepID=A0A0F9T8I4_9ZZZZ